MKAFLLVVLLILAAPAFGQSGRYDIGTGLGWGAAVEGTMVWYNCAKGSGAWGSGMLEAIEDQKEAAINDAGWNIEQLDDLRQKYESGEEPKPPIYGVSVSTASNGWAFLRVVARAFPIALDAYTYWKDNKNYKASVLYAKIHDDYNGRIDSLDDGMRSRTENCVYMENSRAYNEEGLKEKFDIGYTGENRWLAYPIRKGIVTVHCVANC